MKLRLGKMPKDEFCSPFLCITVRMNSWGIYQIPPYKLNRKLRGK